MINSINLGEACLPARVYFYITVFSIAVALFNGINIISIVMKVFFAFVWFGLLKMLCDKGYENISWILVLLPFVIIVIVFFKIVGMKK